MDGCKKLSRLFQFFFPFLNILFVITILDNEIAQKLTSCSTAIRIARIVKESVSRLDTSGVRWFVFGDDDTVFFTDNLVRTLSKYDPEEWYYIGSGSEGYEPNMSNSFGMAFGGGGFAISASLARVLAGVLDSCLVRYPHLYGSDARVFSCLAELGVELTREPGFHQVQIWGLVPQPNCSVWIGS